MCLAVPSKVIEIRDTIATIDVYGARRDISLLLLPEEVGIGDYVLVHAGFAIQKIDKEAGDDALRLISEIIEMQDNREEELEGESFHPKYSVQRQRLSMENLDS
ncbi:MAG: HypC/HybG/HupF family hydrogenase formation chaperone [Thermodesulfovibrionales bacterium]